MARDAARKGLVVLKNDKQALPLKKEAQVHLCGLRADNMGVQCGAGTALSQPLLEPGLAISAAREAMVGASRKARSESATPKA